jgi:flagellum-specific ATP synthase
MIRPASQSSSSRAVEQLSAAVTSLRSSLPPIRVSGTVALVTPTLYKVAGLSRHVRLGDLVEVDAQSRPALGQVVRVDPEAVTIKLFDNDASVMLGARVSLRGSMSFSPSPAWKGRAIDALARPIDGLGPLLPSQQSAPLDPRPPPALSRGLCKVPVRTGVRVVDLFAPMCRGQRMGVFAGSGVGKSTLIGMLAKSPGFDTNIIALVGERSREVREFIETILGDALQHSVVVVSSGDESPMMRRQAPRTAMSIAECFRDRGEHVLLVVDSITRFAHAVREVSLAAGEPPVARGYTPSVLSDLPRLLERAGPGLEELGSITGLFSVLVDGDDHNDPISDAARGILDGHIVLDRAIAARGQYPAVDILGSVSRLADRIWTAEQRDIAKRFKGYVAEFEQSRDLRLLGGYKPGASTELDKAVRIVPLLYSFLTQSQANADEDVFAALAGHMAAAA